MKYYKFDDNGILKPIRFGYKTRAVISAELVTTVILVLLRVAGVDVPNGFEAALVVVVGVVIGFFADPSANERVMTQEDAYESNRRAA